MNKLIIVTSTNTMSNTNSDNNIMWARGHKSEVNHCCPGAEQSFDTNILLTKVQIIKLHKESQNKTKIKNKGKPSQRKIENCYTISCL